MVCNKRCIAATQRGTQYTGRMTRLALLSVFALATALHAQANFTAITPTNMPSPRAGAIGVSDGAWLYNFGGKPGPGVELNDMWVFDGSYWTDLTPATGPLPAGRDWYGAAYDTGRARFVLFGGRSSALGSNLGDTWEFDGAQWTQLTPVNAPSVRRWNAMAYDAQTGVTILFGGEDGGTYNNETWSWDGTNWTQLTPTTSPSPRGRGRLSYDMQNGNMVYFGGRNAGGALSDTWVWDGADWSQVATANAPSSTGVAGRFAYGMTYDFLRDRHVLYGGTRNGPTLSDAWEFDGVDWTQRSVSGPVSRTGPTFAYVLGLQSTYLFGGFGGPQLNDTWAYQTSSIPSAAQYGAGCAGPGGVLSLSSSSAAWAGDVWTGTCSTLGATSLALEVWGLSQVSLPLNAVIPVAPPGCLLLANADVVAGPSVPSGGVATVQLAIPSNAALAGFNLHVQVAELEFDFSGNWVGLYTSNGLTATIGVR